jgi:hypothetical protein
VLLWRSFVGVFDRKDPDLGVLVPHLGVLPTDPARFRAPKRIVESEFLRINLTGVAFRIWCKTWPRLHILFRVLARNDPLESVLGTTVDINAPVQLIARTARCFEAELFAMLPAALSSINEQAVLDTTNR